MDSDYLILFIGMLGIALSIYELADAVKQVARAIKEK